MPVTVKIQSLEDANNGVPLVEGLSIENVVDVDHFTMGILEKGTLGGQTTVMFVAKTPDGKHVVMQATGNEFNAMHQVFKAADERFNPKK